MSEYVEVNELQKFCRKYTKVDAVGLILANRTDLLHGVKAIPLDKVKQAKEEIENLTPWDEGTVEMYEVLEILDKLITESEET